MFLRIGHAVREKLSESSLSPIAAVIIPKIDGLKPFASFGAEMFL